MFNVPSWKVCSCMQRKQFYWNCAIPQDVRISPCFSAKIQVVASSVLRRFIQLDYSSNQASKKTINLQKNKLIWILVQFLLYTKWKKKNAFECNLLFCIFFTWKTTYLHSNELRESSNDCLPSTVHATSVVETVGLNRSTAVVDVQTPVTEIKTRRKIVSQPQPPLRLPRWVRFRSV